MAAGLLVALALMAGAAEPQADGAAAYGPELPAAPPKIELKRKEPSCAEQAAAHPNAIVVCAPRPQDYRLNTDVMEAKRDKRRQDAGRPTRPGVLADQSCKVGPRGCIGGGLNIIGVALTASEMAARIARGQEIGSMFVTDPQKTEYDFYVEAKKEREAEASAAEAPEQAPGPPGP